MSPVPRSHAAGLSLQLLGGNQRASGKSHPRRSPVPPPHGVPTGSGGGGGGDGGGVGDGGDSDGGVLTG